MQTIHNKLTIDVNTEKNTTVVVAKAEDSKSRYIDITLTCAGEQIIVGNSDRVVLMAEDAQTGSTVAAVDCTVSGGIVTAELDHSLLSAPGTLKCEIVVYGTNSAVLTSATFKVLVTSRIDSTVVEREEDFSALVSALSDVASTSNRIDELAARVTPVSLGGTGATDITSAAQTLKVASVAAATAITANADLNDYNAPGTYEATQEVAATLTNSPVSTRFKLYVLEHQSGIYAQIIVAYRNNEMYFRGNTSTNTYSSWQKLLMTGTVISETGTWVPTATEGTITPSTAKYVYDGKRVTLIATIVVGSDITGTVVTIGGLPIANSAKAAGSCVVMSSAVTPSLYVTGNMLKITGTSSLAGLTLIIGITYTI